MQANNNYESKLNFLMDLGDRKAAFVALREKILGLNKSDIENLTVAANSRNAWFTSDNIKNALEGITHMLEEAKLSQWLGSYKLEPEVPQLVGIVMAGNIPFVGFHDLLCVLISGNVAVVKPSSDDQFLTETLVNWIFEVEPRFKKNLELRDKLNEIDAVIATGSDNTSRYFEYYFKNIPHIIRKNRTSIAVLHCDESEEELVGLGDDIFSYFGLGCRNVSKLYTPEGYDVTQLFEHFDRHKEIIHHHKYRNNYDYYKSIYLVNKTPHLDTGFLLTTSTNELVSPISVLYHQAYKDRSELEQILKLNQSKIQCVVEKGKTPFGTTQRPELWDYADEIDTISFLSSLGKS